jgi:hypothetical protein
MTIEITVRLVADERLLKAIEAIAEACKARDVEKESEPRIVSPQAVLGADADDANDESAQVGGEPAPVSRVITPEQIINALPIGEMMNDAPPAESTKRRPYAETKAAVLAVLGPYIDASRKIGGGGLARKAGLTPAMGQYMLKRLIDDGTIVALQMAKKGDFSGSLYGWGPNAPNRRKPPTEAPSAAPTKPAPTVEPEPTPPGALPKFRCVDCRKETFATTPGRTRCAVCQHKHTARVLNSYGAPR